MILTCPSCAARYLVAASQIGLNGRMVRCGKCQHSWFTSAEEVPVWVEPIPRLAETGAGAGAAPAAASAAAGSGESPLSPGAAPAAAPELRPIPRGSNLPAFPPPPRQRTPLLGWTILILALAALLYGSYVERARIVAFWPPAARLYMLLHIMPAAASTGLEIRGVTTERLSEDGVPVLHISGEIANLGKEGREIPLLAAVLKDARERNLQQWIFRPAETKLAPGTATSFSTKLKNPTGEATDVDVEFLSDGG